MASSSDMTEIKRYLLANGLCANCSIAQGQDCVNLYALVNSKIQAGTLSSNDLTELKRLILSNMSCTICMSTINTFSAPN
jgi:hypothetical protein